MRLEESLDLAYNINDYKSAEHGMIRGFFDWGLLPPTSVYL